MMSAKPVNVEMSDPSRSKGMGDSGNEDNPFDDSDLSSGEGDENDKQSESCDQPKVGASIVHTKGTK